VLILTTIYDGVVAALGKWKIGYCRLAIRIEEELISVALPLLSMMEMSAEDDKPTVHIDSKIGSFILYILGSRECCSTKSQQREMV